MQQWQTPTTLSILLWSYLILSDLYSSHPNYARQAASLVTHPFEFLRAATFILHLVVAKSVAYNICSNFASTPPQPNNYNNTSSHLKNNDNPNFGLRVGSKACFFISNVTLTKKKNMKLKLSCGVRPTNRSSKDTDSKLSQSGIKNFKT